MWSRVGLLAYRAARKVMTLDVTAVVWLERSRLSLPDAAGGFTYRFLAESDVRELARDSANDLSADMAGRIAGGCDFCFAAFSGDRVASYAWFALGSIEAEHHRGPQPNSGVAVSFPAHVAFMYKGFTHPSFRGRKLYGAVVGRGLIGLQDQEVDTLLSTMDWSNVAARAALARIGFVGVGYCWRWGWGDWMHTRPPEEARRRGARFGSHTNALVRPARA